MTWSVTGLGLSSWKAAWRKRIPLPTALDRANAAVPAMAGRRGGASSVSRVFAPQDGPSAGRLLPPAFATRMEGGVPAGIPANTRWGVGGRGLGVRCDWQPSVLAPSSKRI